METFRTPNSPKEINSLLSVISEPPVRTIAMAPISTTPQNILCNINAPFSSFILIKKFIAYLFPASKVNKLSIFKSKQSTNRHFFSTNRPNGKFYRPTAKKPVDLES